MQGLRSRRWCFTLNNYSQEELAGLGLARHVKYLVMGKETGESGTPHLQGYVIFSCEKSLRALSTVSRRAHWSMALGSTDQNYTYCTKDGDFTEIGVRPQCAAQKSADTSERQKARWTAVINSAKAGTCEEEFPQEFLRYNATIRRLHRPVLASIPVYCGMWFHGPPGLGKSRRAREEFPGAYEKLPNKWWCNYESEESVLIDDLSMDHGFMGSFLKRYADHYPFRAEYKGGSFLIRPKNIIVTSNYTPAEIWPMDHSLVAAIERRFTLIEIN